MNHFTRRHLLGALGLSAGASLLAGNSQASSLEDDAAGRNWRYVKLDPAAIADKAYGSPKELGCMYGVFASICGALADAVGEPFRSFPCQMMGYGHGGAGGHGSLCGALNGAAAMIGLLVQVKDTRDKLITELFAWCEAKSLPMHVPKTPVVDADIAQSVARSVLCHISVGRWMKESGCNIASQERQERCRRLTADVALKTVELLNQHFAGECNLVGLPASTKECIVCHGKSQLADAVGQMDCRACHTFPKKHP